MTLDATLSDPAPADVAPVDVAPVDVALLDEGHRVDPLPVDLPPVHVGAFAVPTNLSPSRVDAFTSCPLAFRFSSLEKLPEPPSAPATKGSLVHRALELLFTLPNAERTLEAGLVMLGRAAAEFADNPDFSGLGLDNDAEAAFLADAEKLVRNYFKMEDPTTVRDIGLELRLEVPVGSLRLRGIIDRLDLTDDGELVVTDYKTGKPPRVSNEQSKLGGVHFYAYLCQELFGQRPVSVQLMYLSTGETIVARPTENSVKFLPKRTLAVWNAVEKACVSGDFKPRQGPLCNYCAYQAWCPAFGGDPDRAALEAPAAVATMIAVNASA
jgi:putative RecB family exonuclease